MAKVQNPDVKKYPDVSKLLKEKEERRKQLAKLPIAKKLAMVTKLRDATRTIRTSKRVDMK
jgi:hypothetical protein